MQPGDRVLCAFVNNQPVGTTFKDWPVHVTIVPWFRLDIASQVLADQLREHYVGSRAFEVAVLEGVQLGYKKQKTVNLVESQELRRLEGQSRRLLHSHHAWVVDEADKTRNGFRPHVTVLKTGRVHEGDRFQCDRLYIISQHDTFKRVDSEIVL